MSDAESPLDDELLALGGSGDEDEDGELDTNDNRIASPHEAPEEADDEPAPRRGVAQKKMRSLKGGPRRRRRDDSEDEEEGEAFDAASQPDSLGSGAMEESDSDTSPADLDDDTGALYPLEGKYHDEKDKSRILSLPEIEREQILAERAAEVERQAQDLQLKRLLASRERDDQKNAERKRKAGAADLDESGRKSSRLKTKNDTLAAYKRQRDERNAQRRKQELHKGRDRSASREAASDADADGEEEVEWDEGGHAPTRDEPPPELKDFEHVRVGRSNFVKVCFHPGFEDAITGCFARVSIGMDRSTGSNMYRMAIIKGFTEGKPYTMEGQGGRPLTTNQYVILAHGKAEKEWPFLACSDSKFTEAEFDRYRKTINLDNVRMPTKSRLLAKLDDIHALLNHRWTEEDIQRKVERQKKLAALSNSSTISAKPFSKQVSQTDRLVTLNEASRKRNKEEVRKALIAEKRAQQAARQAAAAKEAQQAKAAEVKKQQQELLKVPGGDNLDELFGSDISRSGTPALGDSAAKTSTPRSKSPLNGAKEKKIGIPTFRKRNMDDDVIAGLDLGIDIDI